MEARRFDAIARLLAGGRSRRGVLQGAAALAAGTVVGSSRAAAALDGEPTGSGATGACIPVSRGPSALAGIAPPFPATIVAGSCETPGDGTSFPLFDVDALDQPVGAPTAAFVAQSVTTVRVKIDDLLSARYAVVVRVGADDDTVVACGEVGGLQTDDDLTVGLRERNASGHSGVAWLRGSGDSTLVYLFLGRGLSTVEAATATKGTKVVTTVDVNLRAEPSEEAAIVSVIPEGTTLTVTGDAQGDWLPVEEPESGATGYIAAQYLVLSG